MSRRKVAKKRNIVPDVLYNSVAVSRFINRIMLHGKKGVAESIFYDTMEIVQQKTQKDGIEIFNKALENVSPQVEVRSRRVGGATYQVPVEVSERRQMSLSIRWLIRYARERSERTTVEKLAAELIDAYSNTGASIKKKEETFKMAEANKAFCTLSLVIILSQN